MAAMSDADYHPDDGKWTPTPPSRADLMKQVMETAKAAGKALTAAEAIEEVRALEAFLKE